ncbi:MAG: hypothetical protein IT222_13190, partial [Crocinitomix sp.]|nr:hypothetical protein [Crocinitomix sp.]
MIENYFDRISYNCRPHEVFNKDWSSYSPQDFADTFLPYAHIYRGTNLLIVDGAQLFQNVKQSQKNVLTLTQPDEITKIIVYTFAKHSLISSKKINVKPSPEELLTFVEVDENNKLYLEFKFGRNFKKMITSLSQSLDFQNSLDQIETKTFSMSLADFQKKFENGAVHFDQMSMILETIGVKPIKILKQIQQNLYAQLFKKVEDNGFVDFDEVPFDAGQTTGSYPHSWAHGDIERKALTEALYTEEEVFQVYYGNWLRDMSSVIDTMVVGFIARDAKLIRDKDVYKPVNAGEKLFDPFWILTQKCTTQLVGYYTTQTFIKILDEPTSDFQKYLDKHSKKFGAFTINNLGLYRPEEHIDNPKYMR